MAQARHGGESRRLPAAPRPGGAAGAGPRLRRRLTVRGRVQGVGFRPFVYRLARGLDLAGLVGNDSHGAFIEVEGAGEAVERFIERLAAECPPLAEIAELSAEDIPPRGERGFRIDRSVASPDQDAEVAPDVATCEDCLRELFDPADRRSGYPFINCTNCGPRYSIIRAVPYDRASTTMSKFAMCPPCRAEYEDPADRRFHAQPDACGRCGPRVWLADRTGRELPGQAIPAAAGMLRAGRIVAIKGLGGFHLACRADDDGAVGELRRRKDREAKPLAMMVASLQAAGELVELDAAAAAALAGPRRPIVLAPKRPAAPVSGLVAPGCGCFGVMLPYTPLHHLLFAERLPPLVMTSGNPTAEPLCSDNAEALARLGRIADAFLMHDRDIERRVDDSVVLAVAGPAGPILPVRRSRGYAPAPIRLPLAAPEPVLAVGGQLKSAVCLLAGQTAVMSEHLGELESPAAYRNFVATIDRFRQFLRLEPRVVAHDLHPDYAATRYALASGLRTTAVQHHHAHVVACMAENGLTGRAVGVACDGTGYGPDGAVWGCEVLVCDAADFQRAGRLRYFPLPGGDAAARDTWRPAAGLLRETFGDDWPQAAGFAFRRIDPAAVGLTARRLASGSPLPQTSSLGRLFDAAAFLLGVCDRNRFEAEAAMALEAEAEKCPTAAPLSYELHPAGLAGPNGPDISGPKGRQRLAGAVRPRNEAPLIPWSPEGAKGNARDGRHDGDPLSPLRGCGHEASVTGGLRPRLTAAGPSGLEGSGGLSCGLPAAPPSDELHAGPSLPLGLSAAGPAVIDFRPMIREIVAGVAAGRDRRELARAFHEGVAAMLADCADRAARAAGLNRVALTGGCLVNRLVLGRLWERLAAAGREVFVHRLVPPGDGGIALGQAAVAAERLTRGVL